MQRVLTIEIKAIQHSRECCQLLLGKLKISVKKNQTTGLPLLFPQSGPHYPAVFPWENFFEHAAVRGFLLIPPACLPPSLLHRPNDNFEFPPYWDQCFVTFSTQARSYCMALTPFKIPLSETSIYSLELKDSFPFRAPPWPPLDGTSPIKVLFLGVTCLRFFYIKL